MVHVLGADLGCGEQAEKWGTLSSGFDGGTSVGFFAFDDADDSSNEHARFSCGFNGVDGGGAGCADVVDDENAGALLAEALDAAAGSVGLLGFADEEALDERGAGALLGAPGAGGGDVGDDGIRAHSESADGVGVDVFLMEKIEDGFAGEAAAFGVERGGPAVDVVVAGAPGGELELAKFEAGACEEGEKLLSVGGH